MVDIFISYPRNDRLRVWPLVVALKTCGWSVWWDQDIRTSALVDVTIDEHLKSARAVVAVWSCNSSESDWVFGETEDARKRHVLFPVLLDDVELPTRLKRFKAAQL